jgi:hypothetical protein
VSDRRPNRALAVVLAAAAVVGLTATAAAAIQASPHPDTPYLSIAIAASSPLPDGSVRLRLAVDNARDEPLSGHLRVAAAVPGAAASSAATELWTGALTAAPRQGGPVELEVAGACGRRLSIVFEDGTDERRLSTLVPCLAGATGSGGSAPGAASSEAGAIATTAPSRTAGPARATARPNIQASPRRTGAP